MSLGSGIGSMPGGATGAEADNARAFDEAQKVVLGETTLPHLVELPGRGAIASMTGRGVGVVAEIGFDLQPAGWRISTRGLDQRRARSLLSQDLDALERLAPDLAGPLKVQLPGPWTLAATVELPRGGAVLGDVGARRDLAAALALAAAEHVADVRRRLPGAEVLVQLDEPALPAVLSGTVPTASGFRTHRSVDLPLASAALEEVLGAVTAAGATPLVHCCAPDVPIALLRGAGARGVAVDQTLLGPASLDALAETVEAGEWVLLGAVPTADPGASYADAQVTMGVLRLLDMLGLAPHERLVVTPACGLAGADPAWARRALRLAATSGRSLEG